MSFAKWLVVASILLAGCASAPKGGDEQVSKVDDDEPMTGTLLKHRQTGAGTTSADAVLGSAGKGAAGIGAGGTTVRGN
jgi:hypothetical protein